MTDELTRVAGVTFGSNQAMADAKGQADNALAVETARKTGNYTGFDPADWEAITGVPTLGHNLYRRVADSTLWAYTERAVPIPGGKTQPALLVIRDDKPGGVLTILSPDESARLHEVWATQAATSHAFAEQRKAIEKAYTKAATSLVSAGRGASKRPATLTEFDERLAKYGGTIEIRDGRVLVFAPTSAQLRKAMPAAAGKLGRSAAQSQDNGRTGLGDMAYALTPILVAGRPACDAGKCKAQAEVVARSGALVCVRHNR